MADAVTSKRNRDVPARITEYLGNGGLFNPELMKYQAVRDLLIHARDVIETFERENDKMRAALEYIAHGDGYYGMQAREYKEKARSALI